MSEEINYRMYTGPSEAHKAFNTLRGIINGIGFDEVIHDRELTELEAWKDQHHHLMRSNPFSDILTNLDLIISDFKITQEELADIKWLCRQFEDGFTYYDQNTSDLQILQGICHGILADGVVKDEEVIQLKKWLDGASHLSSYYPYAEITSIVNQVLADGEIDIEERLVLKKYFNDFVLLSDTLLQERITHETSHVEIGGICANDPYITFHDKAFCLTGESSRGSRANITTLIEELGGVCKSTVSGKTDYLIVGDGGNPCWSYACYGRKVEKAMNLRASGNDILIIHENDFWDAVDELI